jgi:hypothetical protein
MMLDDFFFSPAWLIFCVSSNCKTLDWRCTEIPWKSPRQFDWYFHETFVISRKL